MGPAHGVELARRKIRVSGCGLGGGVHHGPCTWGGAGKTED